MKRTRDTQVNVNDGVNDGVNHGVNVNDGGWCPGEVAFTKKRLILRRYFSGLEEDNCTICLEPMLPKMALYLPCKHAFHYKCWQHLVELKTYTCPLCRANFSETLSAVGIAQPTVPRVVLTIFTQMDLYDFMLEFLWRSYDRDTYALNNNSERALLDFEIEEDDDDDP